MSTRNTRLFLAATSFVLIAIGTAFGFLVTAGLTVEQRATVTEIEAIVTGPATPTQYGYAIPVAYSFQEEAQRNITYSTTAVQVERGDTLTIAVDEGGDIRTPEGWGTAILLGIASGGAFAAISITTIVAATRMTR